MEQRGDTFNRAMDRLRDEMAKEKSEQLQLLREVSREDGKAADMFATALVNGCKQLMNQIGEGAGT